VPPSHVNKFPVQGLHEIRLFCLLTLDSKGMWFTVRKRVTVNEVDSSTYNILQKYYTIKIRNEVTDTS
jgi:hypothetical protein